MFKYDYVDRRRVLLIGGNGTAPVLALKLPYTDRAKQLQLGRRLQQLKREAEADPALYPVIKPMRWVVAYQKTRNMADIVKLW